MSQEACTRVYKYGARPGGAGICEQMRLGRAYYNQLVEAENDRRRTAWGGEAPARPPHEECNCDECKAHWKAVRKAVRETPPLDLKPLRAKASDGGLYWGTYLAIEQAFAAAWKKTDALHAVRFRSWRQGDVAAVQIQRSRRASPDRLVRIEKADDPRTGRRARDGRGRHTVQIRIGSEGQEPVFCEPLRIEMHRSLQGEIAWVHVRRRWIADRSIWSVAFTCVNCPSRTDGATGGTIAVDVSWRKMPTGEWRLALAQDDAGNTSELRLSPHWAERATRADRIRAHRDERLNELKALDKRFAQVKSCLGVMRKARKDAIDDVLIQEWLARDRHLWQYECGCRRRSVDARRAALQEWTRKLRRSYYEVIIKDTSHKKIKEGHGLRQPAQRQGQHAAPGETVEELRRVFGREHVWVVSAIDTTATCPDCGHVNPVNGERMIRCEQCGAVRDRDVASTRNMLALYTGGEAKNPTARKTVARFAKRHKKSEAESQC